MIENNQIYFNDEEMIALKDVETELMNASKHSFKRNTTSKQNATVREIMAKYGKNYTCNSCPSIVFKMYSDAGKIYFATKEKIELTNEIKEEEENAEERRNTKPKGRRKTSKA